MKIKTVSVLTSLLLVLFMTLAGAPAFADKGAVPRGQLVSQIDYEFVGHLGLFDAEGRLLVWEGNIKGDVTGEMKWWAVVDPPPVDDSLYDAGVLAFYAARWEVWNAEKLLLAGESAGKTAYPDGADGIWDGHGIVTEAKGRLNRLKGRKISETGTVILGADPPFSLSGSGMFLIY